MAAPPSPPPPPGAPNQPLYPGASYGAPGAPPGYGQGYGYPYPPSPRTNGLSIASLVVSIVAACGLCAYGFGGYLGILGAILGHVGRRQIRTSGEAGDGMAMAGIIIGWIATGLAVVGSGLFIFFVILAATTDPVAPAGQF
jgi:hypothetical protein